jgi:Rps23 Pro-64 3,4-dihydroxylase Tpa1-like proline 4-hydroxylase
MFDINQIYKVENFLDQNEKSGLKNFVGSYMWTFNGFSHNPNSRIFWKKDFWGDILGHCDEIESTFRTKIEDILGLKLETRELYMNGQAHGQCGSFHQDVEPDTIGDFITAVYFPQEEWSLEWGGFTIILDVNGNPHIIYPKPNSVVIFNSKLPHVGLEPTVHCTTQRVSMAHKFKILKE